jgi:hypothetical protein
MRLFGIVIAVVLTVTGFGSEFWGVGELFSLGGPRDEGLGGGLSVTLFFPEAAYTNPAGLGFTESLSLFSSYSLRFGTVTVYSLGASGRFWGGSVLGLNTRDFGRDELAYTAYGVVLAAGLPMEDFFSIGLSWRGFFQAAPQEAFGWALSPSFILRFEGLLVGLVFDNVVSEPIDYGLHRESWPRDIRSGVAVSLKMEEISVTLVANARYSIASYVDYSAGAEVRWGPWSLRVGHGSAGLSIGASVEFGSYGMHWSIIFHPHLPITITAGASWRSGR